MERVTVAMTPSEPDAWRHVATIAASKIKEGSPGTCYVAWARAPDAGFGSTTFECELKFNNREYDPAAGEALGDASVSYMVFICLCVCGAGRRQHEWWCYFDVLGHLCSVRSPSVCCAL